MKKVDEPRLASKERTRTWGTEHTQPWGAALYWLTRSSMKVPPSSLTLFFSELTTDPWAFSAFAASFKSDIPMTP